MEENKDMDHLFQCLNAYDSAVSPDLWTSLNDRRTQKRKGPWLFWFSLFLAALAGALAWFFLQGPREVAFPPAKENQALSRQSLLEESSVFNSESNSEVSLADNLPSQESKTSSSTFQKIRKAVPSTTNNRTAISKAPTGALPKSVGEGGQDARNSQPAVEVEAEQSEGFPSALANVPSLPGLKTMLFSKESSSSLLVPDPSCFDFGKSGPMLKALYVDVLAGPEMAFRSLSLKDPSESESTYYLEARDSTEQSWYAYSAQLRASMRYNSGLAVRAGINYTQVNEVFEFANSREVRTTIIDVFDSNGNLIRKDTVQEVGRRYKKTYNRYKYVDIPVMLGYEWDRNKWTMSINAGAYFNLIFTQKGDILSEQLDPVTITTDAANRYDVFEAKAGVSFGGSFGIGYEIAPNLQLLVEPHVRYSPTSIVRQTLDQKYLNVGLFAGLRYYLICRK